MNTVNHALTALFDALLSPFELLGKPAALIAASAVFGVLALIAFKHISYQKGIKRAKDRIKGHLIEIRIYQDDLGLVSRAIGKVLGRNVQYLGLNFAPFLPLSIPFLFLIAQLVVRYAFAPLPVESADARPLPGRGTMIEVELEAGEEQRIGGLEIVYPDGVRALSPLVRVRSEGRAFQEVVATQAGVHEIAFVLPGGERQSKRLAAGTSERVMQPERVRGFFAALLWPAEDAFGPESAFSRIAFRYPDSELGPLPGGTGGVLVVFLIASMVAGFVLLKPLGIEI
jgi:hypothetical protein